jgi:tetratricopeptide (TPR) repeat protein
LKATNPETTPQAGDPQALQVVCVCAFLALAVLAVFGQTAHFGFVNYDDPANVSANPVVAQGLSMKAVGWAFTHIQVSNWIPLTTLSHILDCQLFGLRAGGHHLVNVLFHAATAMLLFLVLRHISGSLWRSAFVAALFAVHPLRAESVAWVSERKDVLSAFFFMLAIGAYVGYVEKREAESRKQKFFYALTLLFFALGLLAKSMVATLPFVLLLLDWWPLARLKAQGREQRTAGLPFWGLVKEKIPLFALSAGSCVAAALVPGLVVPDAQRLPLFERLGNAVVSYAVYLGQMVFPVGLAIPYPNPPNGQPLWKVCLAFVLVAAITAGVMMWRKKRPCLLAGWLWYLGMLVPVIGIIQISPDASHADRYTYLPGIGLAMAATWAVADWSAGWKHRRLVLGGLMVAAIGALAICAYIQTSCWKDSESLWTRALACTSRNHVALNNLGDALVEQGKLEEAIVDFQKALAIQPGYADAHYNLAKACYNLGNAHFKQGKLEEAIAQYRKSLEIQPGNAEALNNLGNALAMQGNDEAAIAQYQKALAIQPAFSDAHYDLGQVLLKQGKLEEAATQYRKAIEIKPDNAEARYSLGRAFLLQGDFDGAMACLDKTAALSPDPLARWRSLGNVFLEKEDWQAAIACYRQAVKINPRSADACADLGMAFYKNGSIKEAIDSWQQALAILPGQLNVLNNLAWLLATASDPSLRDGARAVALAAQASQLSGGGNPAVLHTLAVAYAAEGNYSLAAVTARRALELAAGQKKDTLAATLQQEIKLYEANTLPANAPR